MSARNVLLSFLLLVFLVPAQADFRATGMMGRVTRTTAYRAASCGVGTVVQIDASVGRLVIRHDEMTRLDLPAMTTAFKVRDRSLLHGLQVGERIGFRVVPADDGLFVTGLILNECKCPA
ncbi:MAG: copper-binding protein [Betaproteobacteria bacterium]|nr:copper-binding protein [Betaproteobacteria bacterium]